MFMVPYVYCVESLCGVHLVTRVVVSLLCDHDRRRTSIIHLLSNLHTEPNYYKCYSSRDTRIHSTPSKP